MRESWSSTRRRQKSRTAEFAEQFVRWDRMIGDDCGLEVPKVSSTLTAAGLCRFLASQVEIYSRSPGMDTGRFGSAMLTKAFFTRRRRLWFSGFPGSDSGTSTER